MLLPTCPGSSRISTLYHLSMAMLLGLSFLPWNPSTAYPMGHYHAPGELDVISKSCDYNSISGFAGDMGTSFFQVDYFYTLTVDSSMLVDTQTNFDEPTDFGSFPQDSLQAVVFDIELEIGAHLLRESIAFQQAPCNNRRKLVKGQTKIGASSSSSLTSSSRQLRNVGLSPGPDDEIVAECESSTEPDVGCYWVAGSFQVYTLGTENNHSESENQILLDIEQAMGSGEINDAHEAIINVEYMDSLPANSADGATSSGGEAAGNEDGGTINASEESGSNFRLIVGTSVGALLLLATVALVSRRRNSRYEEQSEFQPSSMDVSEFHLSREESVMEDPLA